MLDAARGWGVAAASGAIFEIAIAEVLVNAVRHGGVGAPGAIQCELELTDDALWIRVFDSGAGFDPAGVASPAIDPSSPERLAETGYGLAIVHAVFSRVAALRRDGLFGVELTLRLDARPASGPSVS